MVFSWVAALWFVGSAILLLPLGIYSVYLWKKNRSKKASCLYLVGALVLFLIFFLFVYRLLIASQIVYDII